MEILDVTKEEYIKTVQNPFCAFDTADFIELNKNKVDEVKYFIFNNGKNRFSLAAGIKNEVIKLPFSASFAIFSELSKNNKIEYYYEATKVFEAWCRKNNIKTIKISLPPLYYNISHITKTQNALLGLGFKLESIDINFDFYLHNFDDNYFDNIQRNARKNYKTAIKNELVCEKTCDIKTAYELIKKNREQNSYPLKMSYEEILSTSKIIETECFVVKTKDQIPIASAITHKINKAIVRVVYWGNLCEYEELRPINLLSYNIFKYYKEKGLFAVDIGPSSIDGIPNYGLCNFKESIGCNCSPKLNFYREIDD